MLQVQHLVIDEVFNGISRNVRTIKDAADHDGIVRRIVVSQALARMMSAPRHSRARHQAKKELEIQFFKNRVQVIDASLGWPYLFSSADLPNQVCIGC